MLHKTEFRSPLAGGRESTRMIRASFEVYGSGEFPFDMLRYDRCWPAIQLDTAALNDTTRGRKVLLHCDREKGQPIATVARWHSFGWLVVQIGNDLTPDHINMRQFKDAAQKES